jgi:hypothetical protein
MRPAKPLIAFLCMTLAVCCSYGPAGAQENQSAASQRAALNDVWKGLWASTAGFRYEAEMHLKVSTDNRIQGQINWTLKKSPREKDQSKIGLKGVEHVKGSYHPELRVLIMQGYRKDDPHTILGLDRYRLILAENHAVLGGITWNHGTWRGLFLLTR